MQFSKNEYSFNENTPLLNKLCDYEINKVRSFINAVRHRAEFVDFILHLHNHNIYTEPQLSPLLRYVDRWEREGMFIIMDLFGSKRRISEIIGDELLTELLFRSKCGVKS